MKREVVHEEGCGITTSTYNDETNMKLLELLQKQLTLEK